MLLVCVLADVLALSFITFVCVEQASKIEQRLFSFITPNGRNRPLVSREAIVSLVASTTTRTGPIVKAALDTKHYELAMKVGDEELRHVRLESHHFHGDWNYTILPHRA